MPIPSPTRHVRTLRRAALAILVAWAGWSLAVETVRLSREVRRPPNSGTVAEWRLSTPRSESLGRFLAAMDAALPPDRAVAFASGETIPGQDFFLSLWAGYFLPRHRVVRYQPGLDLDRVDYVVVYNDEMEDPRLREVARHFSGSLYEVVEPVPTPPPATTPPGAEPTRQERP